MRQISLVCIILAGISLLVGVLFKLGAMHHVMGTVPSSWIQLAQLFLVAAIALKCCGHHHHGQCKDKDGVKSNGEPCC